VASARVGSPSVTRLIHRRKIVVGNDDRCGFFGHLRPSDAHGHSDGCLLQCRGIVDAIPGHRHHSAPRLPGTHDTELVLGGDPCIDSNAGDALGEFLVIHTVELTPHDDRLPVLEDTQLTGDGVGRVGMITGDHHGAHASAIAALDRVEGLGPGWVLQANQSQE